MSIGKFTSLEEARKDPKTLKRFIQEREAEGQGKTDAARFEGTLTNMVRSSQSAAKTSPEVSGEDCSDTRTHPDTQVTTSEKR